MAPTITQVFWRQPWTPAANEALSRALYVLGLVLRELPSQTIDLVTGTVGGAALADCAFRAPAGPAWSCLHLPGGSELGEGLAAQLAQQTSQPALALTEYSQVAWGFSVFCLSEPVQRFLNLPSPMDVIAPLDPVKPAVLAHILGIKEDRFFPYLEVQSSDDVSQVKAFSEDQFALGDPWVRVDFLRSLGITYPIPANTPAGRFCWLAPSPGDFEPPILTGPESRDQPLGPPFRRWN